MRPIVFLEYFWPLDMAPTWDVLVWLNWSFSRKMSDSLTLGSPYDIAYSLYKFGTFFASVCGALLRLYVLMFLPLFLQQSSISYNFAGCSANLSHIWCHEKLATHALKKWFLFYKNDYHWSFCLKNSSIFPFHSPEVVYACEIETFSHWTTSTHLNLDRFCNTSCDDGKADC